MAGVRPVLGLMPTILNMKFKIDSPVVGGLAGFAEQDTGGAVALALSKIKARPPRLRRRVRDRWRHHCFHPKDHCHIAAAALERRNYRRRQPGGAFAGTIRSLVSLAAIRISTIDARARRDLTVLLSAIFAAYTAVVGSLTTWALIPVTPQRLLAALENAVAVLTSNLGLAASRHSCPPQA
jgi:hypothetical protein